MKSLILTLILFAIAPCWSNEPKTPALSLGLATADDLVPPEQSAREGAIWLRLTLENRSDATLCVVQPIFPGGEAHGWNVMITGPGGIWGYMTIPVIEPLSDEHFVSLLPGASIGQLIDIGGAVPMTQAGPQARPHWPLSQTRGTFSVSALYSMNAAPKETPCAVWIGRVKSDMVKVTIKK